MSRLSTYIVLPSLAISLLIAASFACSPTGALPGGGSQAQPTQPPAAAQQPAPTGALKECLDSFPTYPNVKPDAQWGQYLGKVFGGLGPSAGLGYITGDSPEQVTEFYKAEAPRQSWEPAPIQGGDTVGGATLIWGKEDKYLIYLMVSRGDDDKGAKIGVVCITE